MTAGYCEHFIHLGENPVCNGPRRVLTGNPMAHRTRAELKGLLELQATKRELWSTANRARRTPKSVGTFPSTLTGVSPNELGKVV